MSNSFNISVAPEIAAVSALVSANGVIIADIHDTDLPAAQTVIDANAVIIADIHDTDLPAAEVKIDTSITDIAAVKTVVDAVQVKTDAMPQIVRSKWFGAYLSTGNDTWTTVVSVSGSGILYGINETHTGGESCEIRLTLDGVTWTACIDTTGMQFIMPKFTNISGNDLISSVNPAVEHFRFEFWQDMLVEIRVTPAESAAVNAKVHYSVDQF